MNNEKKRTLKKAAIFFSMGNALVLLLQILITLGKSHSFASSIPLPLSVILELLKTLGVHIFLYALLTGIQTFCMWGWYQKPLIFQSAQIIKHSLFWSSWTILICTNAYFFPLSLYSRILFEGVHSAGLLSLTLIPGILFIGFLCNAIFLLWKPLGCGLSLIGSFWILHSYLTPSTLHQSQIKSHIILIGVDSLNPSDIQPQIMPTLSKLINQSVWFTDTVSPLARTYPAWSTILTGLHPFHHQARYNLMPQKPTGYSSIAWLLQKQGYETLFATDDRRFNPIDEIFGFQKIIGPKCGVNDVLLGTFSDFLLSNLLINLKIGKWLFPYNHMNRASYFSYYPQTFSKTIQQYLIKSHKQPLFMAVHFTLPHWPYAFATSASNEVKDEFSINHRLPLYHTALRMVDQQIYELIQNLKEEHLLENTLLILLSDHGEALYTPHSRQITSQHYQSAPPSQLEEYFKRYTDTALDKSAGHGSDLLSNSQYHCLLGFQIYQNQQLVSTPHKISTRVGLQDIAPTILHYIHQSKDNMDGISLLNTIKTSSSLPERSFIMESGMLPNQVFTAQKTQEAAQQIFKITNKKGLLRVRKEQLPFLDSGKLYAILKGDWLLALYPTTHGYLPILQNIHTEDWVDRLETSFAKNSPASFLLKELENFYHHPFKITTTAFSS